MNKKGFPTCTFGNGTATDVSVGEWHHAMFAFADGHFDLYLDGVSVKSAAYTTKEPAMKAGTRVQIAQFNMIKWKDYYFNGAVDEARVSSVARSADYAAAEYKNLMNTADFLTVTAVDEMPEVDPPAVRKYTFTISAEEGGTVTPSGTVEVEEGTCLEITATASGDMKAFYAWSGNCPTTQVFSAKIRIQADCDRVLTARFGTAIYVKTPEDGGNDVENDGFSPDSAKATIPAAVALVTDENAPAVILVGDGLYPLTNAGSSYAAVVEKPIAIRRASSGEGAVVIDGGYYPAKKVAGRASFHLKSFGAVLDSLTFTNFFINGAYVKYSTVARLEPGHILNCRVADSTSGSGDDYMVYLDRGWMKGCTFENISGTSQTRSAPVWSGLTTTIEGCRFVNCNSGSGFVWLVGDLRNSIFINCRSAGSGGAVWLRTAASGAQSFAPCIENCTFVNCYAAKNGGALYNVADTLIPPPVVNCAFSGNSVATAVNGMDFYNLTSMANCLSAYLDPVCGNVTGTPTFNDAEAGDYTPTGVSLSRNTGAYAAWMGTPGATDLAGVNRLEEGEVDIGCYEFPKPAHEDLSVNVKTSTTTGKGSLTVDFEAVVVGDTTGLTYAWDFGDGAKSAEAVVSHTYAMPGYYTVSLKIENAAKESDEYLGSDLVKVMPSICYVRALTSGTWTPAEPYATYETAAANLYDAVVLSPDEIVMDEGAIPIGDLTKIAQPINVHGQGRDRTTLDITSNRSTGTSGVGASDLSILTVSHSGARLSDMTVMCGTANWGSCVGLSAGVISNCVLRGGSGNYYGNTRMTGGTLVDCEIFKASCTYQGVGGLSVSAAARDVLIERCIVTNNTGSLYAAGLTAGGSDGYRIVIRDSLIADNRCNSVAVTNQAWIGEAVTMVNCTVVDRSGSSARNALEVGGSSCAVTNTIALPLLVTAGATPDIDHCFTSGDAKFKHADRGDYRIRGGSPCKNAGAKLDWMVDGVTDLDGNPRVFGGKPDIGCYESLSGGLMLIVR